jgi:DNA-binding NtrC family response regulator
MNIHSDPSLVKFGGGVARVLVVDDDDSLRSNTSRMLESSGHSVTQAAGGAAALEILANDVHDLVLMDVVMPEKGGIESIMELHARHPDVPTVIMSGKIPLGTDAVASLMERYGAKAVLPKPFTGEELQAVVARALSA